MNHEEFKSRLIGSHILAPLTRVGNLPFRRLCVEYGANITISEMVYARKLAKGEHRERVLLRKHSSEHCFGVQLAALQAEEALKAAELACEYGADFIDINCGCPIEEITRRGLGAAILRRPRTLEKLVATLARNLNVPVTTKLRLGWNESSINVLEIAKMVEGAGAAAIVVHGRTREQRYSKAADWELIGKVKDLVSIPVIGNGDLLTPYESKQRKESSNVDGVMIARGALIKPWIFNELLTGEVLNPNTVERLEIYRRFIAYQREHFGTDEIGQKRSIDFLTWHFSFFSRYRYFPSAEYEKLSKEHPLIQTRSAESRYSAGTIEWLLELADPNIHRLIAGILVREQELGEVLAKLSDLAKESSTASFDQMLDEPINAG